jgi:ferredoxin
MAKVDPKKRKFLKHLGLLGFGALIGLGISHATSTSETEIIKNWSSSEIKAGRKLVWENDKERYDSLDKNPPPREPRDGGKPWRVEAACAYHIDDDGDGNYEDSETGKYCTMPCKDVCPVDAVSKHEFSGGTFRGKIMPEFDIVKCIGCTKCFQICGYNAIEWINQR